MNKTKTLCHGLNCVSQNSGKLLWLAIHCAYCHTPLLGKVSANHDSTGKNNRKVCMWDFSWTVPYAPMIHAWLISVCILSLKETVTVRVTALSWFCESFQQIIEPEGGLGNSQTFQRHIKYL